MSNIYAKNGITLKINSIITINDSQYVSVSGTTTNSTTSALVSQVSTSVVNLFFIEDYSGDWSGILGNATGIPGSMKIANSWYGVLNSFTAHATGSTLRSDLLGETAAQGMWYQLGLFHTSEIGGTSFAILSDTPEYAISRDSNSGGTVSAEECDGCGGDNLMFWTTWSSSSQAAGKTQQTLSSYQQHVLKYSPIANQDTNPYVSAWLKSSDNTIALDWKSDSFIYMCLVSDYTYAVHGSYSNSNTRLTWWDGSYNTVSSSGSNILLDSETYVPATLYSTCNPFWINSTSESTSYTYLARSIGYWKFVFTYGSTYTEYLLMNAISSRTFSDGSYYSVGIDSSGNVITGSYNSSPGIYDILDASASSYSDYYTFIINSTYTGISSGCYYYYNKSNSTYSSCYSLTSGTKLYGIPKSYRIISENDEDKIALQKQKAVTKLMNQSSTRLTEQDINAYQRYQHLLRTYESIDKEPLKRFLQSFRRK